jgi:predicted nicotinamide N-methyase
MADDDDGVGLSGFFVCRDYETREYRLGGGRVQLCDQLDTAATDFDMTGQIVWLVSQLTAMYVGTLVDAGELRGQACLELGAGAGLVGLVASHGVSRIVLTDYEPEVLTLLHRNLAHVAPDCIASVFPLTWGCAVDHDALASATGVTRWPLLLGADIIHNFPVDPKHGSAVEALFTTVAALLAPAGIFILGYYDRVPLNRAKLEAQAAAMGLTFTVVPPESFLPSPPPKIFVDEERGTNFLCLMTLYRMTWNGRPVAA